MLYAETIFVVELIVLAIGYWIYTLSTKQEKFTKVLGLVVGWFIMITSFLLIAATIFFTVNNGRVASPIEKLVPQKPATQQQLEQLGIQEQKKIRELAEKERKRLEELSKKYEERLKELESEIEEEGEELEEKIEKGIETGAACRIE